jgi:hypothetical protein
MKYRVLIIGFLLVLGGCASFEEAYIYDREFGQASQAAWESQIVYPDKQSNRIPDGIEGITAEELMGVYNGTFAEKPQQINVLEIGSSGGN